jgi:hypothetical protein
MPYEGSKPKISVKEKKARAKQSADQKALNASKPKSQPPQKGKQGGPSGSRTKARMSGSKGEPHGQGALVRRYLLSAAKGMYAPFFTVLQRLHYRTRFSLERDERLGSITQPGTVAGVISYSDGNYTSVINAPYTGRHPMIVFRPQVCVSQSIVVPPKAMSTVIGLWSVSPDRDLAQPTDSAGGLTTAKLNWIDGSISSGATSVSIYDSKYAAEAVSVPSILLGDRGRVTGAVCCLRITCGPTTKGYFCHQVCGSEDASMTGAEKFDEHSTDPTIKRKDLIPGSHRYFFYGAIENPDEVSTFRNPTTKFIPIDSSPYCSTVISFHNIEFGSNDTAPVIEFEYMVGVQMQLSKGLRTEKTNHANEPIDVKVMLGSEGMSGGMIGTSHMREIIDYSCSAASSLYDTGEAVAASSVGKAAGRMAFGALESAFRMPK